MDGMEDEISLLGQAIFRGNLLVYREGFCVSKTKNPQKIPAESAVASKLCL